MKGTYKRGRALSGASGWREGWLRGGLKAGNLISVTEESN